MATSEATRVIGFITHGGNNSPACHPAVGWRGNSSPLFALKEGVCWTWTWTFLMLPSGKPESHRLLIEVTALGDGGCDREETPPLCPWPHCSFSHPVTQIVPTEAALGRTFGKGVRGLKLLVWCRQEDSVGNPKEKEVVEPRKIARIFFGLRHCIHLNNHNQINIENYSKTWATVMCWSWFYMVYL